MGMPNSRRMRTHIAPHTLRRDAAQAIRDRLSRRQLIEIRLEERKLRFARRLRALRRIAEHHNALVLARRTPATSPDPCRWGRRFLRSLPNRTTSRPPPGGPVRPWPAVIQMVEHVENLRHVRGAAVRPGRERPARVRQPRRLLGEIVHERFRLARLSTASRAQFRITNAISSRPE